MQATSTPKCGWKFYPTLSAYLQLGPAHHTVPLFTKYVLMLEPTATHSIVILIVLCLDIIYTQHLQILRPAKVSLLKQSQSCMHQKTQILLKKKNIKSDAALQRQVFVVSGHFKKEIWVISINFSKNQVTELYNIRKLYEISCTQIN